MMISRHSRGIAISFAIVLGLSLVMMVYDLSRMSIMQSKLDVITQDHKMKSMLMMDIRHGIYERQVSLRNILLLNDIFDRDEAREIFNRHAVGILAAREKFTKLPLSLEEKDLLIEINEAMKKAYVAQVGLIDRSIYSNRKITKKELQDAFNTQEFFIGKVNQMILLQNRATRQSVMDAERSYKAAQTSVFLLGGSSLILGIFVAAFVIRRTESQAREVQNAMSEIEKSNDLLEERVEKRTHELALARDEALASNKAKDSFLANMSHELRTPLNIIIGYSEILEEDAASKEDTKNFIPDIKKIQNAARHQVALINQILDIAKIEEGKLEINPVDFDVEVLVSELEQAAKPLMAKNNNAFNIYCAPGIGMMYSDNVRIHQILLNLLGNAAKFTENGVVSLKITRENNPGCIEFIVEDTGVGIPESYMNDLFKKFTQADSSTTRKYGGSGLGLSISKQLSNRLNGDITVSSEEGQGSRFVLSLPVVYVEEIS